MRKVFWCVMFVCLMGISFSVGHMWCERHCGVFPKCPDKCLVKSCDCCNPKCCQDKALQQKCGDCICTLESNCGCIAKCDCCKKK